MRLVRILVLATLVGGPVCKAHATPGQGCQRQCAVTFNDTLQQQCPSCAPDIVTSRKDCNQKSNGVFRECIGQCPGFAGRCTITRECVNGCRDQQTGRIMACTRQFSARLRKCTGSGQCLAIARRVRNQCLRRCRRGLGASATAPGAEIPSAAACACQPDCIASIAGGCFNDCNDRCGGDPTALSICRGACRDAQCQELEDSCTQGGSSSKAYEKCCTACGNCSSTVACSSTSSTSTLTTTSTTSTSTTTVTFPPCTTLGSSCGSCGNGTCLPLCAHSCTPVCVSVPSPTTPCATDAVCAAGQRCAVSALGCPGSCGLLTQSACVSACP